MYSQSKQASGSVAEVSSELELFNILGVIPFPPRQSAQLIGSLRLRVRGHPRING